MEILRRMFSCSYDCEDVIVKSLIIPNLFLPFAGLLMLVPKFILKAAVPYVFCKFYGTLTVTLTWEFFHLIQFSGTIFFLHSVQFLVLVLL